MGRVRQGILAIVPTHICVLGKQILTNKRSSTNPYSRPGTKSRKQVGKTQIGIAMSGGVDSTACALLLREEYQVHGFFMQLAQPKLSEQLLRVKKVAEKCSVPLTVIDLRQRFEEKVLNYFSDAYHTGRTPNPCMICNREIKFGLFMDAIFEHGMTQMATGHYANIVEQEGCFFLQQGKDEKKDQSYFLARLSQRQLAGIQFPLGKMTKDKTYDFVESHGFHDFRGQESQDVCFLGDNSVGHFLQSRSSAPCIEGDIVHIDGRVLGHHRGITNYTIGQRRGLGIAASAPLYVITIDAAANRIIVGDNNALFKKDIEIKNISWNCAQPPRPQQEYRVRIRYGQKGQQARINRIAEDHYAITFAESQRAVAPGQFAVIYKNNLVLGSGEIR